MGKKEEDKEQSDYGSYCSEEEKDKDLGTGAMNEDLRREEKEKAEEQKQE